MAITRQEWPNSSTAISDTDETEVLHVFAGNASSTGPRGCTFYIYSSAVAATATAKYVSPANVEKIVGTAAIPAGGTAQTVLDFNFPFPEVKLYITLGSASASTVTAECVMV
tara:strand:+ start:4139 stop:4474 length:336 start_codon:yes stop_codon:yes gene_type:complete